MQNVPGQAGAAVASLDRLGGAVSTILRENYASVILCEKMKEALEREDSAALFAATLVSMSFFGFQGLFAN